jgi:hypothetical protein
MSSVTEIYVCKLQQDLKKGKLFTSGDIHDRADAELDARERCASDDTIAKIGYYAVDDEGGFKSILIYENPNVDLSSALSSGSERDDLIASAAQAHAETKEANKPRASLFSKVVTFFTEEA